ncbi:Peroxisomal membrane protein 2 [Dissostichus eleginoides]|uniref:Peroxisomal membrane protein 2 n=1 Tax=Dissostichus eleginoides TaxID=100907 RepID=A0AAD9C0L3_DISEL|nr:Peroxisomal membrane protein 2 [Dissostichus eleginoides]
MKLICKSDGFLQQASPCLVRKSTNASRSSWSTRLAGICTGHLLSQILEARKKIKSGAPVGEIDPAATARYATFGFFITGPVSHIFYQLMEVWMPKTDPLCIVKRLLLDRLIFAPGFLLMFYFVMNILEAKGWRDFESKMRGSYWTALKMNWKVWTPFQLSISTLCLSSSECCLPTWSPCFGTLHL